MLSRTSVVVGSRALLNLGLNNYSATFVGSCPHLGPITNTRSQVGAWRSGLGSHFSESGTWTGFALSMARPAVGTAVSSSWSGLPSPACHALLLGGFGQFILLIFFVNYFYVRSIESHSFKDSSR